ncbi:MAG: hypothetical protein JWM59_4818 [Verrucomicrobiales bacterium]|nr:hypothetical protein [Verrucomicrobiales bacterium]
MDISPTICGPTQECGACLLNLDKLGFEDGNSMLHRAILLPLLYAVEHDATTELGDPLA